MPSHMEAVFIVRGDRPDLYELLRDRLGSTHRVILDRRGELDGPSRPGERRQPLTASERKLWRESGYVLVFEPVAAAGRERQPAAAGSVAIGITR